MFSLVSIQYSIRYGIGRLLTAHCQVITAGRAIRCKVDCDGHPPSSDSWGSRGIGSSNESSHWKLGQSDFTYNECLCTEIVLAKRSKLTDFFPHGPLTKSNSYKMWNHDCINDHSVSLWSADQLGCREASKNSTESDANWRVACQNISTRKFSFPVIKHENWKSERITAVCMHQQSVQKNLHLQSSS